MRGEPESASLVQNGGQLRRRTAVTDLNHTPANLSGQRFRRRLALSLALVLAGALIGVACGDDDDDASTDTTAAESADDPTDGAGADESTSEEGDVVEVSAVDYAFEGLPASVPAGTRLAIANDAPAELHELVAIRLPDDETRTADELMALPEAEADALLGGGPPAAVLLAEPGGEPISAVGDGTLSEPGRYLVLCAIPTGVAPADYLAAAAEAGDGPPQVEGGPPHFVHGMYTELVVE
jgi:hypothetical protein